MNRVHRTCVPVAAALCLAFSGCGGGETAGTKDEAKSEKKGEVAADKAGPAAAPESAVAAAEPGESAPAAEEAPARGPAAVAESVGGKVEILRTGGDTWTALRADEEIKPGDQIRVDAEGSAVLTLADESVATLSSSTAVALGDSEARREPASSVIVLGGAARFKIAARAKGEGPFMIYGPASMVGAKGTEVTVGVAVDGTTRAGVDEGAVEVLPISASPDKATPLAAGKAAVVSPGSTEVAVGAYDPSKAAEWDDWLAGYEERLKDKAAEMAKLHRAELERAVADEEKALAELKALSEAEAKAAEPVEDAAERSDEEAYKAAAPELAEHVDAVYMASLDAEAAAARALAHAYLLGRIAGLAEAGAEVVTPHRAAVVDEWKAAEPVVRRHLLVYPDIYAAYDLRVVPMRPHYYRHHPRGRVLAPAVGFATPPFVSVSLAAPPLARAVARRHIKRAVWWGPEWRGKYHPAKAYKWRGYAKDWHGARRAYFHDVARAHAWKHAKRKRAIRAAWWGHVEGPKVVYRGPRFKPVVAPRHYGRPGHRGVIVRDRPGPGVVVGRPGHRGVVVRDRPGPGVVVGGPGHRGVVVRDRPGPGVVVGRPGHRGVVVRDRPGPGVVVGRPGHRGAVVRDRPGPGDRHGHGAGPGRPSPRDPRDRRGPDRHRH